MAPNANGVPRANRRCGVCDAGSEVEMCTDWQKKRGRPLVCKDGVTISKEVEIKDPEENLGAQMTERARHPRGFVANLQKCQSVVHLESRKSDQPVEKPFVSGLVYRMPIEITVVVVHGISEWATIRGVPKGLGQASRITTTIFLSARARYHEQVRRATPEFLVTSQLP